MGLSYHIIYEISNKTCNRFLRKILGNTNTFSFFPDNIFLMESKKNSLQPVLSVLKYIQLKRMRGFFMSKTYSKNFTFFFSWAFFFSTGLVEYGKI